MNKKSLMIAAGAAAGAWILVKYQRDKIPAEEAIPAPMVYGFRTQAAIGAAAGAILGAMVAK